MRKKKGGNKYGAETMNERGEEKKTKKNYDNVLQLGFGLLDASKIHVLS